MATSEASEIIRHLRKTVLLPDGADLTDGQLLEFFLNRRDEAAMEVLVRRHGPMIWGVCRRLLHSHHDAEDAFQATFLVFVRKAASIASRELLANWLYGVAHQTALKARATVAKRKGRERQVTEMPEPAVVEHELWDDLRPLLDKELSRLPDKYRAVIVLCDLEGKSRKEAARQLGLPEGTVGSRLARARALLAKRLSQRGVVLSGGSAAAVLSAGPGSASAPPGLVASTIRAASLLAAGRATGVIPVKVAALTEGVVKAMFVSKLKAAFSVVLILGFMATGATILSYRTAAGQDDKMSTAKKPVEPPARQVKREEPWMNKETVTAWGKEVDGLQAGLGIRPERRAFQYGETVTLVVRVRNVGKEKVKFQYLNQFFFENPPTVKDADGKKAPQIPPEVGGLHTPKDVSLAPGKEIELSSLRYRLTPASEREIGSDSGFMPLYVGTGKVTLQYERLFGNTSAGRIKVDPNLRNLTTGKLELEIKPKGTPWGEEVEGLQCQLRADKTVWKSGDQPAFKLVVRDKGKRALQMHMAADGCEVEFDGSWFRWQAPVSIIGGLWPAGKQYDDFEIPVVLEERWGNASGKKINLSPGKHTVRVAFVTFDKKPVRAVSNAVQIEITAPAKEDKGKVQEQKGVKNQQAKVLELTDADNGKTCMVETGELIVIRLAVHLPKDRVILGPNGCTVSPGGNLVDTVPYPTATPQWTPDEDKILQTVMQPRKPDTCLFLYRAIKPGTCTMQCFGLGNDFRVTLDIVGRPEKADHKKKPVRPVPLKAVYLVGKQGGGLSAEDLKKHPEVKAVQSFADFRRLARKETALWIDVTAIPLLQGEDEHEWIIRRAGEEYTFAVIGCNEPVWCFRDQLDCFGFRGPGPIDWTKYELSPGFSVIRQTYEKVGKETRVSGPMRGYKVAPTVQRILNVTDSLVGGQAPPDSP